MQLLGDDAHELIGTATSESRRLTMPSTLVPSTSTPVASMGLSPSCVRHAPTASKFSIARPIGSKILWHDAQAGLV